MISQNWEFAVAVLVGYLLAAFVAGKLVRTLWRVIIQRATGKITSGLAQQIFRTTRRPVYLAVVTYVVRSGFVEARERIGADLIGVWEYIDGFFYTLIVGTTSYLVYSVVKAVLDWYLNQIAVKTDSDLDDQFIPVLDTVAKVVVVFIGTTMVLSRFEVDVRALLGTAGIASLAVAFAAQETLANMIAGFTILVDRPFRTGDRIELDNGQIGDVFEIGLRSTKILSFDNTLLVVPNKDIAGAKIVNHSYPSPRVKVKPQIGVAYGSDMEKVLQIILDICRSHPKVLSDPEPTAYFTGFGDSALNVLAVCWIEDYRDKFQVIHDINMEIKRRFEAEGIEIPFPHREVYIHNR